MLMSRAEDRLMRNTAQKPGKGEAEEIRILLIEDCDDHARLFTAMLEAYARGRGDRPGYHLTRANDLQSGSQRLGEAAFEAILLDLGLPDSQGLSSLATLVNNSPDVPVIVITSQDDEHTARQAVAAGAQEYLVKGKADGELLARTIHHAMERHRLGAKLAAEGARWKASEQRVRHLIEANADAILVINLEGVIRFANPAAAAMLGQPTEGLVGRDFGHPLNADRSAAVEMVSADGKTVYAEMHATTSEWDGEQVRIATLRDIGERRRAEDILSNVARGVSAQTGENFFDSLTEYLADTLQADYALVGELTDGGKQVQTVAVLADGKRVDNMSYALKGTPCDQVMGKSTCHYPDGVQALFPEDVLLQDMGVQAYMGTPLLDSDDQPIGILILLWREPLRHPELATSMLEIFATRAASELSRLQAVRELEKQHNFLQEVIDGVPDPIMVIDADYRVRLMNKSARAVAESCCQGRECVCCYEMAHRRSEPCNSEEQPCPLDVVRRTGKTVTLEHIHYDAAGEQRNIEVQASPLFGPDNNFQGIIESSRDVTERRRVEEALLKKSRRLDYLAHHDVLTGLPNRILFYDRLQQALGKARRHGEIMALLFLDLDRFKHVNDSMGHGVGDELLRAVGQRLKTCLREIDTVARLGGDEFTIILEGLHKPEEAADVAAKIVQEAGRPLIVQDQEIFAGVSLGIGMFPQDAKDAESLMRVADAAMYHAKDQGRGNFQFYNENLKLRARSHMLLESGLHHALERREFRLYYQPQISATDGTVVGMEALIRWDHPVFGILQ
ncbi:MAG: hypothetical protein DRQ37_05295, partial [Gammaproteobacteria bacterium]